MRLYSLLTSSRLLMRLQICCQRRWREAEAVVTPAGGEIASTFDTPEAVKLGRCKVIEEIMIGEDKLVHFSGVALGEACTIVLRGASARALTPGSCRAFEG